LEGELKKFLLRVPKKYENRFLSKKITLNTINVFEAKIQSILKNKNTLIIMMYLPLFSQTLKAIIFNPKNFHMSCFGINQRYNILAKISEDIYGNSQIIQPKIIPKVDIIHTIYTRIAYKSYIEQNMNKDNLKCFNMPDKIINILLQIHNPSFDFFKDNLLNGKYENQALYALKYIELFLHLSALKTKRRNYPSLYKLDNDITSFILSLPFNLTKGQKNTISQIQKDFISNNATKRIIMGDVGCGKTIVMLASAMIAIPRKSLIMAPTSILAKQIYNEAKKHIPNNINIQLISKDDKTPLNPDSHIFIGTHVLLYRELVKDIALVMIDEQHKFGTKQRYYLNNKFKKGKKKIHTLQFSATPIPRTMFMIESAIIDFSFITDTPFEKNIISRIIFKKHFPNLIKHIEKEINKNHQIIIVYPLVEQSENINYKSLEEAKEFWTRRFKNTYFAHGKDKEKELIIKEFKEKGSILLSTTMVEVGISLPRVSTMIVVGAERFGLSTLHQLRGRLSRIGLKGYLFLFTNKEKHERLEEFIKTKSGFDIANLDLKYRNSGDLLKGKIQSGKEFKYVDMNDDLDIINEVKKWLKI
jgi:ATP-dependent DNA helicase RecG